MRQRVGLLLLLTVVIVVGGVALLRGRAGSPGDGSQTPGGPTAPTTHADPITLKGYVGSEKAAFLKDPQVIQILQQKFGLTLDFDQRGSLDMVKDAHAAEKDFLWPSSQVALELYKEKGLPLARADIIFNSPVVLYSWASVTEALIRAGVVRKEKETYYVVDFPKFVKMILAGKEWKDLGMAQLHGRVVIYSTDPTQSNSGTMFAGLLADVLNNGEVVSEARLPNILPRVQKFFEAQGYMETRSDDIFQQFLNQGMGAKPIIIGYESQLLDYSLPNAAALAGRKETVRILYPKPTVWSSHPLMALNDRAKRLSDALLDPELQRIAWTKHGFRSAAGVQNDPKTFQITGVPETIENVVPMPSPRVTERILQALGGK
jgi:ABC-type Fe3+ transport system substrate-binding protein